MARNSNSSTDDKHTQSKMELKFGGNNGYETHDYRVRLTRQPSTVQCTMVSFGQFVRKYELEYMELKFAKGGNSSGPVMLKGLEWNVVDKEGGFPYDITTVEEQGYDHFYEVTEFYFSAVLQNEEDVPKIFWYWMGAGSEADDVDFDHRGAVRVVAKPGQAIVFEKRFRLRECVGWDATSYTAKVNEHPVKTLVLKMGVMRYDKEMDPRTSIYLLTEQVIDWLRIEKSEKKDTAKEKEKVRQDPINLNIRVNPGKEAINQLTAAMLVAGVSPLVGAVAGSQ